MFVRAFSFFPATKKCCYFVKRGYKWGMNTSKIHFLWIFSGKKVLNTPNHPNHYENYFFGAKNKVLDLPNKMLV